MRIGTALISASMLSFCACNQTAENRVETNEITVTAVNETASTPAPAPTANAEANVSLPDDRTPLEEPKGPIDPKSAEAAGQVVQHYAALIEQRRWSEANAYWGDAATAASFRGELAGYSEVHMEIGKPGDSEGAAGSIYITVPAVFYGKTKAGGSFRRGANMILCRVNDIPGSTEAQRRWHIERVEWTSGG
jgi:hypothetical protein